MRSAVSTIAAGLAAALTLAVPTTADDGWRSSEPASWLQFQAAITGWKADAAKDGRIPGHPASVELEKNLTFVELPINPENINVPPAFKAAVSAALDAGRSAVAMDADLHAILQNRGYEPDDLLGVTGADDGSVTVFVGQEG
jgi:hypothetical protein